MENPRQEALRLKSMAEAKFRSSNLNAAIKHAKKAHNLCASLDGLSSMLTAFKIISVASKAGTALTDWYKILQVEPFSHINTIKKQYKKLALVLHPDKNPYVGCEEAFKLVGEGFRVLSDKIRRKEYDMRLRIRLQDENVKDDSVVETFWTACSRCMLLHQFERKYLGHNLVCPSCKRSFEAVEVEGGDKEDDVAPVRARRRKVAEGGGLATEDLGSRQKTGGVGSRKKVGDSKIVRETEDTVKLKQNEASAGKQAGGRMRTSSSRKKISSVDDILERSKPECDKVGEEMMTLAQLQLQAKEKANQKKAKLKEKQKDVGETERVNEKSVSLKRKKDAEIEKSGPAMEGGGMELETRALRKSRNMEVVGCSSSKERATVKIESDTGSRREDLQIMAVDDSDFYDFDKDRVERSFKKGQVWAIYHDADGMPGNYGLINEVVSVHPFRVKLSWLDLQSNGDEGLICWEKMGFHVSCGRFKVAMQTTVDSVNIFSHVVECERAAREVYRIYPKKGSVWAVYKESVLGSEGRNGSARDICGYDIVVFLTSYSEMHGLSAAYLEKVDGFKSIFKRRELGPHAIKFFKKDDVQLFSHQIPARKASSNEVPELLRDCWELDPAALPSDLSTTECGR